MFESNKKTCAAYELFYPQRITTFGVHAPNDTHYRTQFSRQEHTGEYEGTTFQLMLVATNCCRQLKHYFSILEFYMAVIISPSLLSADFANLKNEIDIINNSEAEWLHLDIMDGVFVPNISFGFPVIKAVAGCCRKKLDAHFMIVHPEKFIQRTAELGVMMMTVHAEVCENLHNIISDIHNAGMKAGIALNPATPLQAVESVLHEADMFLVMSVNPGFSGQKFIAGSTEKVAELRKMLNLCGSKAHIQVDGGINGEIAQNLVKAGADVLVCGNYVFKADNPAETIRQLRQIAI